MIFWVFMPIENKFNEIITLRNNINNFINSIKVLKNNEKNENNIKNLINKLMNKEY
jgi:glycyl-tRNA synthetase beta subunit